jgi:hypothetical protein
MAYGQGVHAYFSGRSAQADELLSTAIAVDPQDPRPYYFRGLARLRQGRRADAISDLQIGASLEAQQLNRYAIGAALMRVQGADRLLLEQYRRAGRLAERQYRVERDRERYEQVQRREPEVLHLKATIALDQLLGPNGSQPVVAWGRSPRPVSASTSAASLPVASAAAPASSDNPFPDDPLTLGPSGTASAPAARPGVSSASGSAVRPPSADENPFGGPASRAPAASDNPFGAPASRAPAADENPFGSSATSAPTSSPPATSAPAADDNPFGVSPASAGTAVPSAPPDAGRPAATTPPSLDEDPFRAP